MSVATAATTKQKGADDKKAEDMEEHDSMTPCAKQDRMTPPPLGIMFALKTKVRQFDERLKELRMFHEDRKSPRAKGVCIDRLATFIQDMEKAQAKLACDQLRHLQLLLQQL